MACELSRFTGAEMLGSKTKSAFHFFSACVVVRFERCPYCSAAGDAAFSLGNGKRLGKFLLDERHFRPGLRCGPYSVFFELLRTPDGACYEGVESITWHVFLA